MRQSKPSKQTQFRLPPWAVEFIERAAEQRKTSKTQVVLDALECLREHELEELMAEGYETAGYDEELLDEPAGLHDRGAQAAW
jgi:hypothetical protein